MMHDPGDDPSDDDRAAMLLEAQGRYEEALALCEQALSRLARLASGPGNAGQAGEADRDRAEAQFNQRRLRLLRKLRRPVWSSQGTPW